MPAPPDQPDVPADVLAGAIWEGDGWRLESKGRGQFGFRRGGGYKRETMRGTYLATDQLDEVKRDRHKQEAERQAGAKQRARRARGE
jgi:hypothetical protein